MYQTPPIYCNVILSRLLGRTIELLVSVSIKSGLSNCTFTVTGKSPMLITVCILPFSKLDGKITSWPSETVFTRCPLKPNS